MEFRNGLFFNLHFGAGLCLRQRGGGCMFNARSNGSKLIEIGTVVERGKKVEMNVANYFPLIILSKT